MVDMGEGVKVFFLGMAWEVLGCHKRWKNKMSGGAVAPLYSDSEVDKRGGHCREGDRYFYNGVEAREYCGWGSEETNSLLAVD